VVSRGKPFQFSLMFVVRAGAYHGVGHLKGESLGQAPALLENRRGRKSLPRTNTLAYDKHAKITDIF
jgi:hypothetical protein